MPARSPACRAGRGNLRSLRVSSVVQNGSGGEMVREVDPRDLFDDVPKDAVLLVGAAVHSPRSEC